MCHTSYHDSKVQAYVVCAVVCSHLVPRCCSLGSGTSSHRAGGSTAVSCSSEWRAGDVSPPEAEAKCEISAQF